MAYTYDDMKPSDIYGEWPDNINKSVEDLKRNSEHYSDPTAYSVMKKMDAEEARFHKLLNTIFYLCDLADFHLEERVVLTDKRTGRTWR